MPCYQQRTGWHMELIMENNTFAFQTTEKQVRLLEVQITGDAMWVRWRKLSVFLTQFGEITS